MRSNRTSTFSLATAMSICLRTAMRLILLKAPHRSVQQEAEALAKLGSHVAELRGIYERGAAALARRLLGGADLDQMTVEIVKLEDGFAMQFRFKEK